MEVEGLGSWLRDRGYEPSGSVPETLCRKEFGRLWDYLGVPGVAKTNYSEPKGEECQKLVKLLQPQHATQELQSVKDKLSHKEPQQGAATECSVEEQALRAYGNHLQTIITALSAQEKLLKYRADETVALFPPVHGSETGSTGATKLHHLGEQALDRFESEVTTQVLHSLAENNLAAAKLDWTSVASAAQAKFAADCDAEGSLSGCPAAIFSACSARSEHAAEALRIEIQGRSQEVDHELSRHGTGRNQNPGDEFVYAAHNEEVKLFFQTQKAAEQEQKSEKALLGLMATVERLCGGSEAGPHRKRLLLLQAENAGNRAAVTALDREMEELRKQNSHLQEVQATLTEIMETVINSRMQNLMLDYLMHDLVSSGTAFLDKWLANTAAVDSAISADVMHHQSSFPGLVSGVKKALQGDYHTLQEAPFLIRSALTDVWDEDESSQSAIQQKRKLKHQLRLMQAFDRAFSILKEAASSVTLTSGGQIGKTHANFKQLATTDCQALEDLHQEAGCALDHGTTTLPTVLQVWWEQPAAHAVPWIRHDGKNAKEWLTQIQAWHASEKHSATAS